MSYEPRGKVKLLADAMLAEPGRIWTSPEVAKVMDVHQGALSAHLDTAVRHGAIYRKLEAGRCQYSLKPFATELPAETAVPKQTGFVPVPMLVPRAGSDRPHVSPPSAPMSPQPTPEREVDEEQQDEEQQDEGQPDDAMAEESEPAEFNACAWADGEVTIYGAQENEDGSVTLKRDQVAVIRKLVAWMPAQ